LPNSNIQSGLLNQLVVKNQMIPPEGPVAIPLTLDFSIATGLSQYTIDLSQQEWQNRISMVQSIFIDLSATGVALTLQDLNSGHTIVANAHTQGWYSILSPVPTRYQINCDGGANNVAIFLCNTAIPGVVWAATHP
jgi:hypothetical protein